MAQGKGALQKKDLKIGQQPAACCCTKRYSSLLGAVAPAIERVAVRCPLGLPADGLNDGRPMK